MKIPLPLHRLTKRKILWLNDNKCKHRHTYLQHYPCYVKDFPKGFDNETIGYVDIESSNLEANFGIILTWCVKIGKKIYHDQLSEADIKKYRADKRDTRIVGTLVKTMLKCDRVVGHYSSRFDFPFIRTRALICGVKFPPYGMIMQDDTWRIARNKLRLNSNRLETVCRTLFGETQKTHLDYKFWIGGLGGDQKCLKYILEHNKFDVIDLERIYLKLRDYINVVNTSI